MDDARPLHERYWYIEGPEATRIDLDVGEFWSQVMADAPTDDVVRRVLGADGWLVSEWSMDEHMAQEEMHPNGDELHVLTRGRVDLVLAPEQTPGAVASTTAMRVGECAVVPRGAWHRFVIHEPATGIALTAGRGTEHRPIPEEAAR